MQSDVTALCSHCIVLSGRGGEGPDERRQWAGTFSRATADARDISGRTVAGWPVYPGGK